MKNNIETLSPFSKKCKEVIEKSLIIDICGEKKRYVLQDESLSKKDKIQKAFDLWSLKRSDKIKFKKTGKQIKEAAEKIEDKIIAKKIKLENRLKELDEMLVTKPTDCLPEWYEELNEMPDYKLYSYEQLQETTGAISDTNNSVSDTSDDIQKLRREWNNNVYSLHKIMCDLETLKTFTDNIDLKASYEMNLGELKNLNF